MDWTTLQHTLIALAFTGLGYITGNTMAGVAVGCAIFITRELTQAEYRWIDRFGQGKRSNMPWWACVDYRVWDIGSITDWLVPCLVSISLGWFTINCLV